MTRRLIVALVGVAFLLAVLARILITPVTADRGRNEMDYLTIHDLPLAYGAVLTQPVALQNPDVYGIDLPYRWEGQQPARLQVAISGSDGTLLSDAMETLNKTTTPDWLEPTGDGSIWQHLGAKLQLLRAPRGATNEIIVRLTRVDHEPGTLVLFASNKRPGVAGQPAFVADSRLTMVERPGEILEFESEYGNPRPAWQKVPTYFSRLQSLAPPWLPFPMPEFLLLLMITSGLWLSILTTRPT